MVESTNHFLVLKLKTKLTISKQIIAFAMIGRDAKLPDSLTMLLRGIAFVREPVVLGIFLCKLIHIVIAIGLGENRSRSYREILAVALDNRRMGQILVFLKGHDASLE